MRKQEEDRWRERIDRAYEILQERMRHGMLYGRAIQEDDHKARLVMAYFLGTRDTVQEEILRR